MDKILDNINPTLTQVREWAFDEELYFTSQDEDLLLYDPKYIPVLLELGSNPDCPKSLFITHIFIAYIQFELAIRNVEKLAEIEKQIISCDYVLDKEIEQWRSIFLQLNELIKHPRIISKSECRYIANLLIGVKYGKLDFVEIRTFDSGFIEYRASSEGNFYKEYFYINPRNANWVFSRFQPLESFG